jgi:predicted nucleic acid-binding protein
MTVYYCDSSILIKRHIHEPGSQWFHERIEEPDTSLFTTEISIVEVCSALNRRLREEFIDADEYRDLMTQSWYLFGSTYDVVKLSEQLVKLACSMLERHPLRAIDAVHLATGIFVNERLLSHEEPSLIFLSADHHLLTAATAEGVSTFDPSTVP